MYLCRVDTRVSAKRLIDLLPAPIAGHASAFGREDDLRRSSAAWLLLDYALRKGGHAPLSGREITVAPGGKPFFAGEGEPHFSLSHSGEWVACALDVRPIGVDIERIRPYTSRLDDVARRVCTDEELAAVRAAAQPDRLFTALWCLKESYAKALGKGLSLPLRSVTFHVDTGGRVMADCPQAKFALRSDLRGYMAAVCRLTAP
jgi:4'-phosphopantetheinyl transferase